ncbi:MAG: AAA family ATPase, partial [Myxococcales bacterium]|nr:AAA family ATPase [Myxococcales bacterium]
MSTCPSCQAEVAATARFCSNCGTRLQSDAPAPPVRRHRSESSIRAERRQLTVMFCDIAGSTQLSEQLDAEDLMAVVRRYQTACAEVIERLGGSIAQYLGDGLLVYFGYPTAYENAPERAARAGLEMLAAVDTLNESLRAEFGVAIKIRLGIHTGLVVIGEVGGGSKREELAVGDTANIAARLEGLADPQSGIISDATRQLIAGLFETEPLGPRVLKGIASPMEVFRLVRLSDARHRLEGTAAHSRTPFVGRAAEMNRLRELWRRVEGGQGSAALLVADAGVGKSRMIPAFKAELSEYPHRLHEAYCSPFFTNSVLHALVEMLRVEMGIGRDDPAAVALGKLGAWWSRLADVSADAVPLLAGLLAIPPEAGYEEPALSPQARKLRTAETLLSCLLPADEGPPTLLVVEDVHWVDPSTLDLLAQLVERLADRRVMVLMTARPVFESPWRDDPMVTELRLRPLSGEDTEALVRAMTVGRRLPRRMLEQLIDRTDGIPLFVEEMTRMLMDAGQLEDTKTSAIPTTLHDSLMARLDRITPVARKVAQLAATIGRMFELDLVAEIFSGDANELRQGIDQLLEAKIILRKRGTSAETYLFKHALIQDAAYESLLKRTRQTYHARIADALERDLRRMVEVEPELLAQHLEAAGPSRAEAAARQWLRAGERAQASSSNQEAIGHLRRGLALLPSLPDSPQRVQLELSLQSKLGTALSAIKGYAADEVERAYARAHELCEQLGQTPERFWVLWGLWAFYLVQGTHEKGVRFAEMMLALASEQQAEELELEAHFSLGLSSFFMGDDLDGAREHLDWVVERYDPERHHQQALLAGQDVGVTSRSVLALVCFQRGELDTARARHQDALVLSERLGHAFSRAYALGCAAWFQLYLRDYERSQGYAEQAVALSQEQSFGWWLVWGTILGGSAAAGQGQPGAAAQIEEWIDRWRQTGSGFTVPYFLGLLCD